ncbi:MAG: tryptophan synthase subunit alpha, partial [Actinomycetales bacterium]
MSQIDDLFERTRAEGRAALVGYLPAGFPDLKTSIAAVEALVE